MAKMSGKEFPKRGEIYWTDLEPTRGSETKKKRPGLIVSNDIGNELSNVVMVAPITSKATRVFPFEVRFELSGKPAKIMLNQTRALDKSRLDTRIGQANDEVMQAVAIALKLVFAIE
jgi:mRNA interferase MazF